MSKKFSFTDITAKAKQQQQRDKDFIKENIVILRELETLIPPLEVEERRQLEQNILEEGCRDPLVLWENEGKYVIVDGHNRFDICKKNSKKLIEKFGYDFRFLVKEFENIEAVKDWMVDNQLGKRNLSNEWKSYLRGRQYQAEKNAQGGDRKKADISDTAQRLAEQHKVSKNTIKRDAQFAEALQTFTGNNANLKQKILNRNIRIPKSTILEAAEKLSESELEKVRAQLEKGTPWERIAIFEQQKTADDPALARLRQQILESVDTAIYKKDASILEEAKNYLEDLGRLLR
jgi:hypothetical protein